ncbi:hypothetical protein ACFX1S_023663 [Malus domestica]|uniref:PGG domain-containing protein n=1 Tax=Malus domestica TaxID=3750 RepID=A0A498HHX0_MALDO|nr:hypothetical protein DVH24_037276 [Malus domestica]
MPLGKWMKDAASSYIIVNALVITIMFVAAFIVPGENNQETSDLLTRTSKVAAVEEKDNDGGKEEDEQREAIEETAESWLCKDAIGERETLGGEQWRRVVEGCEGRREDEGRRILIPIQTLFLFRFSFYSASLKEAASFIEVASSTKEVRRISRAVRLTVALRRKLTAAMLSAFLDFALLPPFLTPSLFLSPFSSLHQPPHTPIRSSPYSKPPNPSSSPWLPRLRSFSSRDCNSLSLKCRSATSSVDSPPPAVDLR